MRPFLTAEWCSLVMLNYEIDPAVLAKGTRGQSSGCVEVR